VIGHLRGKLIAKQAPTLLVDVNGVGYELEAPMSTFYQLPEVGSEVSLHTQLVVREDAHTLYGFASQRERQLFRDLIRVSGVGARMALTILSGISVEDFARCVHDSDAASLTRLPGVGKKTAERLIVEMRDRLTVSGTITALAGEAASPLPPSRSEVGDAVSALISLGYKPQEASRMVRAVDPTGLTSEEIIRQALQGAVAKGH